MNIAPDHPVVTGEQWTTRRRALLQREKELTRLGDQVAAERRALPWERVEKNYVFDTAEGKRSLAELFQGRRQLMVQHFMLGTDWEAGCPSCSYMADHTDGMRVHLAARDVSFVAVSRAPLARILKFRERMGWGFDWASSAGNDFNRDFHVSFNAGDRNGDGEVYYNFGMTAFPSEEAPGISVFRMNGAGEIFRTYSTFGRGVEVMMGTYHMLDLTPSGRDENDGPYKMDWVRHHDRYAPAVTKPVAAPAPAPAGCCGAKA